MKEPASLIREAFFSFFESERHLTPWESNALVPVDDRTLPVMHAALNELDQLFLRKPKRGRGSVYSLKCIRINDVIGDYDSIWYHGFSEILGTWGACKKQAIRDAWGLLTEKYSLLPERIYVSYYAGDENSGLVPDTECRDMWMEYLPTDRIYRSTSKANFWNLCDGGPCGPCSVIYYDQLGDRDPRASMTANDHTCPEIWTIVFVDFFREEDGSLKPLQGPHVVTGMDFEQTTAVIQKQLSHYDTDIFTPILKAIHSSAGIGIERYCGNVGSSDVGGFDTAYRVMADHFRIISVATANDTQIGKQGRKYLLKLMDRRAIEFGHEKLKLCGKSYPELVNKSLKEVSYIIIENQVTKGRQQQIVDEEVEIYKNTLAEIAYEKLQLQYDEEIKNMKTKGKAGRKQGTKNILLLEPSSPMTWYKTRVVNCLGRSTHHPQG